MEAKHADRETNITCQSALWSAFDGPARLFRPGGQLHLRPCHRPLLQGRSPKIDGDQSRVHLFNNFWNSVTYFSIGIGSGAQARVEGNYFEDAAKPHWDTGNGLIDADLSSNRYISISASDPDKDTGAGVFGDVDLYRYTLEPANDVPAIVDRGAGPR
jgi:pectate lyase